MLCKLLCKVHKGQTWAPVTHMGAEAPGGAVRESVHVPRKSLGPGGTWPLPSHTSKAQQKRAVAVLDTRAPWPERE